MLHFYHGQLKWFLCLSSVCVKCYICFSAGLQNVWHVFVCSVPYVEYFGIVLFWPGCIVRLWMHLLFYFFSLYQYQYQCWKPKNIIVVISGLFIDTISSVLAQIISCNTLLFLSTSFACSRGAAFMWTDPECT